jgi:hypothetical protein
VQNEDLVAWKARLNEPGRSRFDVPIPGVHARAGIQDKPYRCRAILPDEQADGLTLAVLLNLEVFSGKVVQGLAVLIEDPHIKNNEIDING